MTTLFLPCRRYRLRKLQTAENNREKAGAQIYEEIGERVAGCNASTRDYEDLPDTINTYEITPCSAYGVPSF